MKIIGISAYYHDSAVCLVEDGYIVAAAQEERFSRKKHDARFPRRALQYCLKEGGITISDCDYVAYYEKPFLKFERLLETYGAFAPRGVGSFKSAIPVWLKEKLFLKKTLCDELNKIDGTIYGGQILFTEHHESHAASAFYCSPYKSAAIITADGVGEWATTVLGYGVANEMHFLKELQFPHSLGLLYSAFTYYTGFKVNSGEYKVMGLAPYGEPKYVSLIKDNLIDIKADGSFRLNLEYFDYCTGFTMTNKKFDQLFDGPPRKQGSKLTQKDMNLARSIQEVIDEVMLKMTNYLYEETGNENLCLAGGVALNCVSNGKILKGGRYKNIWIQPAAGDAGGAIGAALAVWHRYLNKPRDADDKTDMMRGSYLGPCFNNESIRDFLETQRIPYIFYSEEDTLLNRVADIIAEEKVIGWFQGRMEFGPRALGNRSIIGDARSTKMQSIMNLRIKFRESFRPFAPSVLWENMGEYFELSCESLYMLLVAPVCAQRRKAMTAEQENLWGIDKLNIPRSDIPAVTHVDYSARVQSVHKETNPRYWNLIKKFEDKTGCGVIVNTSFNVRGEPIVCTPEDAYRCFMRTEMDYLVMGDFLLDKQSMSKVDQNIKWKEEFTLD